MTAEQYLARRERILETVHKIEQRISHELSDEANRNWRGAVRRADIMWLIERLLDKETGA